MHLVALYFYPLLSDPSTMETLVWILLGALAGLVAGSFLATLVVRWPRGESLSGRSRCEGCARQLPAIELVPVLSHLASGGRCRQCGSIIPAAHMQIELGSAAIGALALTAVPGPMGFAGALFGWILLALAALDLGHYWLPDRLTMPLLALGLLLGPAPFTDRVLAAAIGGGGLLAVAIIYRRVRGRDGLGLGDVKLMAAIGAWLSPVLLAPLLLLAALCGLASIIVVRLNGRAVAAEDPVPFGAFLAAAAFPMWLVAAAVQTG